VPGHHFRKIKVSLPTRLVVLIDCAIIAARMRHHVTLSRSVVIRALIHLGQSKDDRRASRTARSRRRR